MHLIRKVFFLSSILTTSFAYSENFDEIYCQENCPDYGFYIAIEEGYMAFNAPRARTGAIDPLGSPTDFIPGLSSSKHSSSNYTKLDFGAIFPCFTVEGFGFLYDDRENSSFNAITTVNTTFSFQAINGIDQSPLFGFFSGATFAQALKNEFIYRGIGLKIEPNAFFWNFCDLEFYSFLEFDYSKLTQNYSSVFGITNAVGTTHQTNAMDETLATSFYDLGIGIAFDGFIYNPVFIAGNIGIYGSYAHSHLTGQQVYQANFAATADQQENVNTIEISKNNFAHKFKAGLEVGMKWNHFAISAVGNVENWGYIGQIVNPFIDPAPAKIGESHLLLGSVGLKVIAIY